ncbi:MAG: hypothetical protein ROR55_23840 [Devosia sp.]
MLTRRRLLASLAATTPGIVVFSPAHAHHGFGGRYDRSAPVWLEGEVASVYFGQPHAELFIIVSESAKPDPPPEAIDEFADGLTLWPGGGTVEVEFPPVRQFFALDGAIRSGDRVAIVALRNCQPPGQLRGQAIRLPDGEWVVRRGRMQTEVDGCR